ncbi:hypothetical protein IFR05_007143 [Cadophora sp. M221]|nr:hypothetical protein IFR05_007143 [Cadophora sp. M221]
MELQLILPPISRTRGFQSGFFLKEALPKFDAAFFSMTAAEAAGTDPQQRKLLELAYEAFENAGMTIQDVAGSSTSCYVGAFSADYTVTSTNNLYDTNPYAATGLGRAMLSNRVSWFFDLRGASVTLDTACSSALVGMHLAIQGLRSGEEKMALVGASNLFWQLEIMRGLTSHHFLSPDGKCHSFDEAANGYGRGEGLGFLILKPLKDALRDNDTIRAVIRGSGLNQDGKTPVITMPSKEAQIELIRTTYRNAGLELLDTQYFEAHGTGTAIGDPIELSGIGESIGVGRTKDNAVVVGSVKTNLGHLESAAGMAGIMKAVLAMEHGVIPGIVGLNNLNPKLKLDEWRLKLNTELISWPVTATGIRRASVNSFGYGGANAHAIVDDAKHYLETHNLQGHHSSSDFICTEAASSPNTSSNEQGRLLPSIPKLLILSSPEQTGVGRLEETYAGHFEEVFNAKQEYDMDDLAYTLGERRTIFDWRLPKPRRAVRTPTCAYVFTGQGAQYANMGRELLQNSVFRQSLEKAGDYLASLGCSWSVVEELDRSEETSRVNQPEVSQPLCTILQVAMVCLLEHWGVYPKAVIGHSSGEIGAAFAAGHLSCEDAWKIAYFRGLYSGALLTSHPELSGAMMAVALSEESVLKYITKCTAGTIAVACINSPLSVTLSGDLTAIDEVEILLQADEVRCKKLKVETAYHSPHMTFIQDVYLKSIRDVEPLKSGKSVEMFSSVTGRKIMPSELGSTYWVRNMLSPVRFSGGVESILLPTSQRGHRAQTSDIQLLVEIGPHGVLKGPISQILASGEDSVSYISLLHRGKNAYSSVLEAAGCLWTYGHKILLNHVNSSNGIPTSHKNAFKRLRQKPRTDLLGYPDNTFNALNSEHKWINFLKPFEIPWVMDHVIQGLVVLPGGASLAMAIEACQQIADTSKINGFDFRDVNFTRALMFGASDQAIEVSMVFRPENLGTRTSEHAWHRFTFSSIDEENITTEHSNGLVRIQYASSPNEVENGKEADLKSQEYLKTYQKLCLESTIEVEIDDMYKEIDGKGMQFGPMFRLMKHMRGGQDSEHDTLVGVGSFEIPDTAATMPEGFEYPLLVHPAVVDAVFQIAYSRISCGGTTDNVTVISSLESLYISSVIPNKAGAVLTGYNKSWQSVIAKGVRNAILAADHGKKVSKGTSQLATRLHWKVDPRYLSQASSSILGGMATDLGSNLLSWFDMVADKNPNLHILEIGTGSSPIAPSIIGVLDGKDGTVPRYSKYSYLNSEAFQLTGAKVSFHNSPNIALQQIDIVPDLEDECIESRTFDVILISDTNPNFLAVKLTAEKLQKLIKPGGHLVVTCPANNNMSWFHDLESHGLTFLEVLTQTSSGTESRPSALVISSMPRHSTSESLKVVIIEPNDKTLTSGSMCCSLTEQLLQLGHIVTKTSLGSVVEPSGKIFISLLEVNTPFLSSQSRQEFAALKNLIMNSSGILWITRGGLKNGPSLPDHSTATGLFRTIRSETPHLRVFNLDLSLTSDMTSQELNSLIVNVFATSFSEEAGPITEYEYVEDQGVIYIPRLVQDSVMNDSFKDTNAELYQMEPLFQPGRPLKLTIGEVGILDTLIFTERQEFQEALISCDVEIQILYSALNFVDVMSLLGYISDDSLGAEFSGVVARIGAGVPKDQFHVGQIVYGLGHGQSCVGSHIRVHWHLLQPVPEKVSPEAAAASQIVFATAYFSLYENGRLKEGDTVLIHSAAGGLGQAAIQLAQKIGAVIYCTVGSVEKKSLLMDKYSIPENHIFSSRDATFAQGITRETKGRGVDMILNSTFGEMLRVTWNCLADFGTMVEVGKRDILLNNNLEMGPFIRGCTFTTVNLTQYTTADCEPRRLKFYLEVLRKINGMLARGEIRLPYPLHVMSVMQAEHAFQLLKSGKMAGKLVLRMESDAVVRTKPRKEKVFQLDSEATYLLAGGLGGIGRSLAELMVKHGAKHLAFFSRSGAQSIRSKKFIEKLQSQGIHATAYVCHIDNAESVEATLRKVAMELPPIKGFVHCAMQLKDAVFDNMTYEDWLAATSPKIAGSWNLHKFLPDNLDFFIMLSSTSGIVGNPGQANYAAGNTFQDGLAHYRRCQGQAATSIDLSAVSGIGYLAENASSYENQNVLKLTEKNMTISEEEIHHIFLAAASGTVRGGKEAPPQITTGIIGGEALRSLMPVCSWANDSKFLHLRKADGQSGPDGKDKTAKDLLVDSIVAAQSMDETTAIIETALVRKLAKSLGKAEVDINVEKPLHAYGVDSLIAVEVRNWVVKELKADISILDILSPMTITTLAAKICGSSKLVDVTLRSKE